ncbi:hypothetical protein MP638_000624 [Amoeboaphelidium occidentale]|nr:hypothetical protein MP638_000624 [Amoeboaphelidium occidentale]
MMGFQAGKLVNATRTSFLRRGVHKKAVTKNDLRFPYGSSSFRKIREKGQFYVDKTHYLETLEDAGYMVSLLRPTTWGKSLFCTTIEEYNCALNNKAKNPEKFQVLFGDTYIGKNTTEGQGKYIVLPLNLSLSILGNEEHLRKQLVELINYEINDCMYKYRDLLKGTIKLHKDTSRENLNRFADLVCRSGYRLYVVVDGHDRPLNRTMFELPGDYKEMVSCKGYDPKSSIFRDFMESLESLQRHASTNVFVTGTIPVCLHDIYGYPFCLGVTHDFNFAGVAGFEESDLVRELKELFPDDPASYSGYRMHPNGPLLYNPQLCLHYFDKLRLREPNYEIEMHDDNVEIGRSIFEKIEENLYSDLIYAQLYNGEQLRAKMSFCMKIKDLVMKPEKLSLNDVLSFMYYYGVVTYSPSGNLNVPNKLVKEQLSQRLFAKLKGHDFEWIKGFLSNPHPKSLEFTVQMVTVALLHNAANSLYYDDTALRTVLSTCFKLTGAHRVISDYDYGLEDQGQRSDIVIFNEMNRPESIVELGVINLAHIIPESLLQFAKVAEMERHILDTKYFSGNQNKRLEYNNGSLYDCDWSHEKKQAFESCLQGLSADDLKSLETSRYWRRLDDCSTVGAIFRHKKERLECYREAIKKQYSIEPKSFVAVNLGLWTTIVEEIKGK